MTLLNRRVTSPKMLQTVEENITAGIAMTDKHMLWILAVIEPMMVSNDIYKEMKEDQEMLVSVITECINGGYRASHVIRLVKDDTAMMRLARMSISLDDGYDTYTDKVLTEAMKKEESLAQTVSPYS